jgi:hypothetical protein
VDSFRIVLLAMLAAGIYGAGILAAIWAGRLTVHAAHASRSIPGWPWAITFVLVVGGMLTVIYGFFFRPRELRLAADRMALVLWDGNGKSIRRDEVRKVEAGPWRIVLRGEGRTLVVRRIFRDWDAIRAELEGWGRG